MSAATAATSADPDLEPIQDDSSDAAPVRRVTDGTDTIDVVATVHDAALPQPVVQPTPGVEERLTTVALRGLEPQRVVVECFASDDELPGTRVVGLPDSTVRESLERVRAAIVRSKWAWPAEKVTINLAPAGLPKAGTGFDLPMALSVLAAGGILSWAQLDGVAAIGELGLDGAVRPVAGTLSVATHVRKLGMHTLVVSDAAAAEAALVDGLRIVGVAHLREAVAVLRGIADPQPPRAAPQGHEHAGPDLVDVVGQPLGKRALEIAAAGGHHMLLVGPPGCGKTLLASRLAGLLPSLTIEQALETAAVHSLAGVRPPDAALSLRPPTRAPHHGTSLAGLIGGGQGVPMPGEVSLATNGVLFLDEALEAPRHVLDGLREPIEHGTVSLSRSRGRVQYPARIQLILAANPCPCGPAGGPQARCRCRPDRVASYRSRMSGPLADRIDVRVELHPVDPEVLGTRGDETSADVRARVQAARDFAAARGWSGPLNRDATVTDLQESAADGASAHARRAVKALGMSARGYVRTLRVARTIADLAGSSAMDTAHIDEALAFRALDLAKMR